MISNLQHPSSLQEICVAKLSLCYCFCDMPITCHMLHARSRVLRWMHAAPDWAEQADSMQIRMMRRTADRRWRML